MGFEIIPFKAFHVKLMNLRTWDRKLFDPSKDFFYSAAKYAEEKGSAFTAMCDEGIVGAAGIVPLFGTTHEAFSYTTDLFPKYKKSVHSAVKKFIDIYFQSPKVERIQIFVDADNETAVRWAWRLGFGYEGTLKNYGKKGQNFIVYAMTKE